MENKRKGVSDELRKRIEEAFGRPLSYPQECEALAMAIEERTGEHLGVTTLKRMLGFVGERVVARDSTMDVIARFLGYADMKDMARREGEAFDISAFAPIEQEIVSAELEPGARIELTYDPGRRIVMTYEGDNRYKVDESQGSKLKPGDRLRITHLTLGFELLASEVEREGVRLGAYQAAKDGGLTSLAVIG